MMKSSDFLILACACVDLVKCFVITRKDGISHGSIIVSARDEFHTLLIRL